MARHRRQIKADTAKNYSVKHSVGEAKRVLEAPRLKISHSAAAQSNERKRVCVYREPLIWQEKEDDGGISVWVAVFGQTFISPTDTAATSIRVDKGWLRKIGGEIKPLTVTTFTADGHKIHLDGEGVLNFEI